MKILYITEKMPFGPGEAFIIPEIQQLIRTGHEVLIVPMFSSNVIVHKDATSLISYTCKYSLLSLISIIKILIIIIGKPVRIIRIITWLKESKSTRAVIRNMQAVAKGLLLGSDVKKLGVEHIHAHWANYTSTLAMAASEVSSIPWSFTAHRYDIVTNNLLTRKLQHAHFVRFISRSGLNIARNLGVEVPEDKTIILNMGVHVPLINKSNIRQLQDGPHIVLCPANLIPVKGHKYLIEAISILKKNGTDLELWIAGQGVLHDELRKYVIELGVCDSVYFLGLLPHSDLLEYYKQGKITMVVLPSIDLGNGLHEGIPVSLIEAMSFEIPVVSTMTGGIPELLGGGAGLLVPPKDSVVLAQAIGQIVNKPELAERLGKAGRTRIKESFSIEEIVDELANRFKMYNEEADKMIQANSLM